MYGKRGVQAARLPLKPGGTGSKLTHRAHNAQRSGCRDQAGSSHTCLRRIAAGRNMSMINTTSNWLALFTHSLFRLFLAFAGGMVQLRVTAIPEVARFIGVPASAVSGTAWMRDSGA